MAEVNDANATGTALPEASAVTNETTMQADTQMTDDVVASEIGGSLVEASAVEALPPDTAAPDGFTRNVEDNLVTSRHAPLIDHETSSRNQASNTTATQSLPNNLELREGSPVPVPPSTATATGSLAPSAPPTSRITFDDYLTLSEITFEWGDSYDDKDWMRLQAILAPTLMVDYTAVNGHKWDSMPASDFVGIMSHIGFVGDPLVHTQHHIGASKWQKISEEEVIGHHQLRAAHQRYTSLDFKVVENKGHGHAMVQHFYRKVDGEWKLAGLRPVVRWNEFDSRRFSQDFEDKAQGQRQ